MGRAFCIPAVFFFFAAFVLLFIVSVSLPYLTAMDITRVHADGSTELSAANDTISQLRFGIWAYCYDLTNGNRVCSTTGHGYSVVVNATNNSVTIGSSWTRGLAVHPVAAGVAFIALLLALSQHITVTLFASLVGFLAALLAFIAFIIDVALFAYVKDQMGNLGFGGSTITGPGFWLTFTSMILLVLGGCTVCFGRRRRRMANATSTSTSPKEGFFSRFRRN
ncbi:pali-domain-containing protein [Pisolithus orientalis]|uniref:pali-domain-containing protein n=1 Tax=Pisolithus orientalis TaxID=936130 RepID=UPI002224E347|nr:pali-domain-containing protein [Pisolithus orientalis]KAI6003180.1 pali-domain-containing protein [Pisolithus orientalis]